MMDEISQLFLLSHLSVRTIPSEGRYTGDSEETIVVQKGGEREDYEPKRRHTTSTGDLRSPFLSTSDTGNRHTKYP